MLTEAIIQRPHSCEDCPLSFNDSDHGLTCSYSGERAYANIDVSDSEVMSKYLCIFNEVNTF